MENGDETLSSPAAAASPVTLQSTMENGDGGAAGEEVTVTDAVHPAKSYAAVAANAEIEDLRLTKHELEEQLANVSQENKTLAAEAHRLEGLFSQAREEVATAEHAAASSEEEVASLRAEVGRLQGLLKQKNLERETDERQRDALAAEVENVRQAKLKLEKEIEDLKASAAAASVEEREAAPAAVVQQKGEEIAWQGMAAAAAAGAAATAAVVLIYLRLKR